MGYCSDTKLDCGDYYYNVAWPPNRRNMSKCPKQPSDFMLVVFFSSVIFFVYVISYVLRNISNGYVVLVICRGVIDKYGGEVYKCGKF